MESLSSSFSETPVCGVFFLFFSMQESILAQVQRVIKGEVSLAMKEQQAAVTSSIVQAMRSAAGTPIPSAHLDFQSQQTHILQLLQQGHLNQAFQQVPRLPGSGHRCLLGGGVGGKRAPRGGHGIPQQLIQELATGSVAADCLRGAGHARAVQVP